MIYYVIGQYLFFFLKPMATDLHSCCSPRVSVYVSRDSFRRRLASILHCSHLLEGFLYLTGQQRIQLPT